MFLANKLNLLLTLEKIGLSVIIQSINSEFNRQPFNKNKQFKGTFRSVVLIQSMMRKEGTQVFILD